MNNPFGSIPEEHIAGEICAWQTARAVTYQAVIQALHEAGLDKSVVKARLPRNAFSRACRKLAENRVIRLLEDDGATMRFQFTAESRSRDEFVYSREAVLALDKASGAITCDGCEGLARQASTLLAECMEAWTAGDITAIVQRLFEKQADLFPIRQAGGAYFVPVRHKEFVSQAQKFLEALGGDLNRWPVPKGTPEGDRSIARAVSDGLRDMVAEYRAAVDAFSLSTRDRTVTRSAEQLKMLKFKIESHAEYLGAGRDSLLKELADAKAALKAKVEAMAEAESQPSTPDQAGAA